ncbi:hypothetical protein AAG570_010128 [Ranatra chinensis]|uniref:Gustatory receptor n=1 Tax=Ranatra chinensis TaxID=642074 RepID=A0ABD0YM28_9HEMI
MASKRRSIRADKCGGLGHPGRPDDAHLVESQQRQKREKKTMYKPFCIGKLGYDLLNANALPEGRLCLGSTCRPGDDRSSSEDGSSFGLGLFWLKTVIKVLSFSTLIAIYISKKEYSRLSNIPAILFLLAAGCTSTLMLEAVLCVQRRLVNLVRNAATRQHQGQCDEISTGRFELVQYFHVLLNDAVRLGSRIIMERVRLLLLTFCSRIRMFHKVSSLSAVKGALRVARILGQQPYSGTTVTSYYPLYTILILTCCILSSQIVRREVAELGNAASVYSSLFVTQLVVQNVALTCCMLMPYLRSDSAWGLLVDLETIDAALKTRSSFGLGFFWLKTVIKGLSFSTIVVAYISKKEYRKLSNFPAIFFVLAAGCTSTLMLEAVLCVQRRLVDLVRNAAICQVEQLTLMVELVYSACEHVQRMCSHVFLAVTAPALLISSMSVKNLLVYDFHDAFLGCLYITMWQTTFIDIVHTCQDIVNKIGAEPFTGDEKRLFQLFPHPSLTRRGIVVAGEQRNNEEGVLLVSKVTYHVLKETIT